MLTVRISAIATTPIKGLRLIAREQVTLGPLGVADNRRFFLVDEAGKLVNGKRIGELCAVSAELDAAASTLALHFPDGRQVSQSVEPGPTRLVKFFSRDTTVTPVCAELSHALSEWAGRPLTLVEADRTQTASDRGPRAVVSLMSQGSLDRLAEAIDDEPGVKRTDGKDGTDGVDGRRFRMLFTVDGLEAHREDGWVEREVRIGEALVRFRGHIGRCRITTMDPDSGQVTLPTLDLLAYRRGLETTEPLALGIYGEVLEPGVVSLGDVVTPL